MTYYLRVSEPWTRVVSETDSVDHKNRTVGFRLVISEYTEYLDPNVLSPPALTLDAYSHIIGHIISDSFLIQSTANGSTRSTKSLWTCPIHPHFGASPTPGRLLAAFDSILFVVDLRTQCRCEKVVALTQDVEVCVVSRKNVLLYLTSGDLDELNHQTQVGRSSLQVSHGVLLNSTLVKQTCISG